MRFYGLLQNEVLWNEALSYGMVSSRMKFFYHGLTLIKNEAMFSFIFNDIDLS